MSLPISDIEALRVVADGQRHRILTVLIEREMTARALAERIRITRTRLYYHLNLLEQHGFIRVVGERLSSGILERTYRATAREFRVDRSLLSAGTSEREIGDVQALVLEQAAEDLRLRAQTSEAMKADDGFVGRGFLNLNPERRRVLQTRLQSLFTEYQNADADDAGVETELVIGLFTTERDAH